MCGLTGFIDLQHRRDGGALGRLVQAMTTTLAHRGPDGSDTWIDEASGVALGHRRLSIIDLSDAGRQPMTSADGRLVIVFNGCVYNFAELRTELVARGHRFRGHSDTEVILEAMAAWGIETAVARFVGMFAIALWDKAAHRLSLIRDRLGIKPLYYGRVGGAFVFGSELRALEAYPEFAGELDRDALALYAARGCIPAPWTVYRGLRKLPPGTILTFEPAWSDVPEPRPYWTLRSVVEAGRATPYRGSFAAAVDELDGLLREAVRCRLVADVPLGVFLSGGIDSSLVAALVQQEGGKPAETFTIGFADQGYDEATDAKAVARHLGTHHHELYVAPDDARAVIPKLAAIYDEPFADSSQIPTYLVAKLARSRVTVTLSGDGGDEVFGGYNRYVWNRRIAARVGHWTPASKRLVARALLGPSPAAWDRLFALLPRGLRQRNPGDKLHKLARVLGADDAGAMYQGVVDHWPPGTRIVRGGRAPADPVTDRGRWLATDDMVDQMMYLDAITYLPDDILTKVDRATMAVGLEARVPYLDHRVVAWAWRLPQAFKIADGRGKQPLRHVLARYVPPALFERPKMGFAVPLHEWLRGPLRDWAANLLAPRRLVEEGVFDADPIQAAWRDHLSGRRNRQHELWNVLMFQAWRAARAERATSPARVA
ncbi:MAG: asparagine synthase (glutamine-hydrolyzing) [Alphaproteobacteria bacterium]|nr:asparagine synthase (glutamine-hydrolyzing) [Alphaproteobacteria bacterium]